MGGWENRFLAFWSSNYHRKSPAEASLEPYVAALGEPYRYQHPFPGLYAIADFVLLDRGVVIEVDGAEHKKKAQQEKDAERTEKLKSMGYRVVRISNSDALLRPKEALEAALNQLKE